MIDNTIAAVGRRQLQGKFNFIGWQREFERAAKAQDVLDLLKGDEEILKKPGVESYVQHEVPGTVTRSQTSLQTPGTEGPAATQQPETAISNNNILRWQIDHEAWKANKEKLKTASKLLDEWVSEGIKIDIEECDNAVEGYAMIKKRCKVSDERARDMLLVEVGKTKLENFGTMTDYINKHRQLKADLMKTKHTLTDDQLVTNLLQGLPGQYRNFKEQYDWIQSSNPDKSTDLDYLFDRLHVEEIKQSYVSVERKVKDRGREDKNGEDTKRNKINCPTCGKIGHTEDVCWTAHPELMPRGIEKKCETGASQDRNKKNNNSNGRPKAITAFASADVDSFNVSLEQEQSCTVRYRKVQFKWCLIRDLDSGAFEKGS